MRPTLQAVDLAAAASVSPLALPPVTRVAFRTALARELSRRSRAVLAAVVATVVALAVLAAPRSPAPPAKARPAGVMPVGPAPAPATPADHYRALAEQAAATCPGLPPGVLYAIAETETRHGADTAVSTKGAVGPMQFLPATWNAYATDGDGDGRTVITSPADAVHSAAAHLCANGGADPHRLRSAIWNYNHSNAYVGRILHIARSYASPA